MHTEFWHHKWQDKQLGFHQSIVNPYLQKHWNKLGLAAHETVLVPLCGKSLDMLWLLSQGYRVIGIELIPMAVQSFSDENDIPFKKIKRNNHIVWQLDKLQIFCTDFFSLEQADIGPINAVYDRAALIALPAEMRVIYAEKIKQLMPKNSQLFQVAINYSQAEMQGPPFSVEQTELKNLYADSFTISLLAEHDIIEQEAHFKQRGLTALTEHVTLLHKTK